MRKYERDWRRFSLKLEAGEIPTVEEMSHVRA